MNIQLPSKKRREVERVGDCILGQNCFLCFPFLPGLLPLDIVGMPEYEKLSEPERVLCTELRLLPSVFAELRAKLKV